MEDARVIIGRKTCDPLVPKLSLQKPAPGIERQREGHKILFICPKDFIALIRANLAAGVTIAFKRISQL